MRCCASAASEIINGPSCNFGPRNTLILVDASPSSFMNEQCATGFILPHMLLMTIPHRKSHLRRSNCSHGDEWIRAGLNWIWNFHKQAWGSFWNLFEEKAWHLTTLTSRSWQKGPKLSVNASCLASMLRCSELPNYNLFANWCIVFSSSNWCHRLVLCPVGRCTVLGVHVLRRYSDGGEALTRDVIVHIHWSISLSS